MDKFESLIEKYNKEMGPDQSTVKRIWNNISSNLEDGSSSVSSTKYSPKLRFVTGFIKNILIGGAFVPLSLIIGFFTFSMFENFPTRFASELSLNFAKPDVSEPSEGNGSNTDTIDEYSNIGSVVTDNVAPSAGETNKEHDFVSERDPFEDDTSGKVLNFTEMSNSKDGLIRGVVYFVIGFIVITIGWGFYGLCRLLIRKKSRQR